MSRTRFLTSGLAATAVASALTLTPTAAHADQSPPRGCGLPAVPALIEAVIVEPVFATIPAVTHTEWRWGRDRPVLESEFLRTLEEARTETDWTRTVPGPLELLMTRIVVDAPAIPAVPATPAVGHVESFQITPAVTVTEVEFRHQVTGNLRWERADWGAQNGQGNGWEKTGNTRETVVVPAVTGERWVIDTPAVPGKPAVPAVIHVETLWTSTDPGPGWNGPFDVRPGKPSVETATTAGTPPRGKGWGVVRVRTIPAVTETGWSESVPDGATATGRTRVAQTEHDETSTPSATSPDGDGWTPVDGSAVTITDTPESTVLITPGSYTENEISPALPATDPCPEVPDESTGPEGSDGPTGPGTGTDEGAAPTTPVVAPVVAPVTAPAVVPVGVAVPATALAPGAALPEHAAPPAAVLPNTGGVPGWMLPTGLAMLVLGGAAVRSGRVRG